MSSLILVRLGDPHGASMRSLHTTTGFHSMLDDSTPYPALSPPSFHSISTFSMIVVQIIMVNYKVHLFFKQKENSGSYLS